jgi:hypothetical protein
MTARFPRDTRSHHVMAVSFPTWERPRLALQPGTLPTKQASCPALASFHG